MTDRWLDVDDLDDLSCTGIWEFLTARREEDGENES